MTRLTQYLILEVRHPFDRTISKQPKKALSHLDAQFVYFFLLAATKLDLDDRAQSERARAMEATALLLERRPSHLRPRSFPALLKSYCVRQVRVKGAGPSYGNHMALFVLINT